MFTADEANVYLQRQNVLISAHGFQFPTGVSEIQTDNFPLMNKIIRAIKLFPDASIEISGHTDSTGSDNINKSISQARAEKVGKFLTDVGEIGSQRITAIGYGESRPLATNKTAEGRAENRRVEIKIINQ
jgi:outer membrane protein OmpA-like peptidoglycan-associated protein